MAPLLITGRVPPTMRPRASNLLLNGTCGWCSLFILFDMTLNSDVYGISSSFQGKNSTGQCAENDLQGWKPKIVGIRHIFTVKNPPFFVKAGKIEDLHTNVSASSSDSWTLVKLVNLLHLHCSKLSAGNLASARELGSLQAVQVQYLDWRFLGNVRWCDVRSWVIQIWWSEKRMYICMYLYSTRLDLWSMSWIRYIICLCI